jgi:hypothetical protein
MVVLLMVERAREGLVNREDNGIWIPLAGYRVNLGLGLDVTRVTIFR